MLDSHSPTDHIDSRSTLYKSPCLITALAPGDQLSHGHKRRRGAIQQDHSINTTPRPPQNKAKRRCQSQRSTNTAYWDSLSKQWLTRRALDELERRNRQSTSVNKPTIVYGLDLIAEPGQLKNLSTQLKLFARHGGPDLRDLVGYPAPAPSTPNSAMYIIPSNTLGDSTRTIKKKKITPYDPNFEQNLIDNGIYPKSYDFPDGRDPPRPINENEILGRLGQPRPSLSSSQFSNKEFRNFEQTNSRALNEAAMMSEVFTIIQGTAHIPSGKNLVFVNLEPLISSDFVNAKPDSYDGVQPAQIDLRIREELGSYIIPASQGQAPVLPNFFAEVKGPDGTNAVARNQACYNGAIGARGIHEFRSFGAEASHTTYDNQAYTLTSTYNDGNLKIYATHPTLSNNGEDFHEYHMTQLGGWDLTGSCEQFRQGAGAFRNARDWAKTQRDQLTAAVNGRATNIGKAASALESSAYHMPQPTDETIAPESETSADELS